MDGGRSRVPEEERAEISQVKNRKSHDLPRPTAVA